MDEVEQRVQSTLQRPTEITSVSDVDAMLTDVRRGVRLRRLRRAVAAAAAAVVAVVGIAGLADPLLSANPEPATNTPETPERSPILNPPPGVGIDAMGTTGFDVTSTGGVWRVSAETCGRVLCARVLRQDGNGDWTTLTVLRHDDSTKLDRDDRMYAPVSTVTVADGDRDAWAYGISGVWSTHDGGRTWTRQPPDIYGIGRVKVVGDYVYALGGEQRMFRSPVSSDDWAPITGPRVDPGVDWYTDVMGVGDRVVIEGGCGSRCDYRYFLSDDQGATWRALSTPCAYPDVKSTGAVLVARCGLDPDERTNAKYTFFRSFDGATWSQIAQLKKGILDYWAPVNDDTILAAAYRRVVLVTGEDRQQLPFATAWINQVEFATPDRGYLITQFNGEPNHLHGGTTDGGHTWNQLD